MRDRAFDQLAIFDPFQLFHPGVILELADGQPDALALPVDADHLYPDFLPDLEDFLGMVNPLPGDLGQVYEAVGAFDIYKSPKVSQAGYPAGANIPFAQF